MFFRLLHVTCGLMIVLLGLNVCDIVGALKDGPNVALATAALATPAAPAPETPRSSAPPSGPSAVQAAAPPSAASPPPENHPKPADPNAGLANACAEGGCKGPLVPPPPAAPAIAADPSLMAHLAEREKELDRKEADLRDRQRLVDAAEEELQRRMTALDRARAQLEDAQRHSDELLNQDSDRLVRIYEAMKPSDAAAIFNILDLKVAVTLLTRMNPRKASAILEAMSPQRAILATQLLANSHVRPANRGGGNG